MLDETGSCFLAEVGPCWKTHLFGSLLGKNGEISNSWECLSVWRKGEVGQAARGHAVDGLEWTQRQWSGEFASHHDSASYDSPYKSDKEMHTYEVDIGVDHGRAWGLEALKHALRMRLAPCCSAGQWSRNLRYHRPLSCWLPTWPSTSATKAIDALPTLFSESGVGWGGIIQHLLSFSTKLCMQILQQDDIEDIFWASELQPVIARLENPQSQHDASEFLLLLWEMWGQTGLQGNWHAIFGGRTRDFDTIPLFIRMPVDMGDGVSFEELLATWANEGNGQCLGCDVQHIDFHIGRYSLCTKSKAWAKHRNRLFTPSTFRCPQRTSTGHAGHSNFVLCGIIAHQGEELLYVGRR